MNTPVNPNRWSYLVAAAAIVLVLGSIGFLINALRSDDAVSPAPSTTPTVTVGPTDTTGSTDSTLPTDSTVPGDNTTDSSVPSDTTIPTATTTPSTAVDNTAKLGWYVVGVAKDDVLNVRQSPSANSAIVGTLAPDAEQITILPMAGNQIGGTPWYGVELADGTQGFVNSRFLAHPNSWDAGLATTACTAATSDGDVTASTPARGDASAVVGLFQYKTTQCDRYVIVLGVENLDAFETAATVGGGDIRVTSGGTRITVDLPDSIRGVAPQATNRDFSQALALTVLPNGSLGELEVRFLHDSSRLAGVTVLSNPARILIDVTSAPTGTGLALSPIIGEGNTLLEHRVDQSADKLGVGHTFSVTGYARWFEAQGYATITDNDGNSPSDIAWSGPSISSSQGAFASVYAQYIPTWGEFTFTIDLPSGSYKLFVGDDCMNGIDDTSQPCGVTDFFDVAP